MKQYKISRILNDTELVTWNVLSDINGDDSILSNYFNIENSYIDIVKQITNLSELPLVYFEIQFKYKLDEDLRKYYSTEDLHLFDKINRSPVDKHIILKKNELDSLLKLILRENVNATVYNEKKEELFGYISDFQTLVYSSNLKKESMKEFKAKGFLVEEFYFSFDFE